MNTLYKQHANNSLIELDSIELHEVTGGSNSLVATRSLSLSQDSNERSDDGVILINNGQVAVQGGTPAV